MARTPRTKKTAFKNPRRPKAKKTAFTVIEAMEKTLLAFSKKLPQLIRKETDTLKKQAIRLLATLKKAIAKKKTLHAVLAKKSGKSLAAAKKRYAKISQTIASLTDRLEKTIRRQDTLLPKLSKFTSLDKYLITPATEKTKKRVVKSRKKTQTRGKRKAKASTTPAGFAYEYPEFEKQQPATLPSTNERETETESET
jgi:hypothetical protein